jgi:hypothetical protein
MRKLINVVILFTFMALIPAQAQAWATAGTTTSTWLIWRGGW